MVLNANKIEGTGDSSQAAINTGSGNNLQIQINNNHYGLLPGTSDQSANRQSAMQDPENRVRVRLSDLVGPSTPVIEGQKFMGVDILGPCIIYPLNGLKINKCTWTGVTEALFIEVPDEWQAVSGVIGLRHCEFENCDFKNIAIMARASDISKIKANFTKRQ